MGDTTSIVKPTFEESLPEINRIVQSRRAAWTYISVDPFEDISQEILMRVFKKWHTFDPKKGPLEHWLNRFVSNAILNEKRDRGGNRWAKPCIGGGKSNGRSCTYNTGGDTCSYTKSGKQCAECPLYADWAKGRQHQFNIKSTVALDNHAQEVSNQQQDFLDIEGIQATLHRRMREETTPWEWRIFACLYIRHMTPAQTVTVLEEVVKKWKRAPRAEERFDYQFVLSQQRWCRQMLFEIARREGYDLQAALNYEH